MRTNVSLAILFLSASFVRNATAGDGMLEISQTCAINLGCFSGDSPGYPVTITGSSASSYRLTSDLILPDAATDGVLINVPRISLDLNGFQIISAACVGALTNCTPASGNGAGVRAPGPSHFGV